MLRTYLPDVALYIHYMNIFNRLDWCVVNDLPSHHMKTSRNSKLLVLILRREHLLIFGLAFIQQLLFKA